MHAENGLLLNAGDMKLRFHTQLHGRVDECLSNFRLSEQNKDVFRHLLGKNATIAPLASRLAMIRLV